MKALFAMTHIGASRLKIAPRDSPSRIADRAAGLIAQALQLISDSSFVPEGKLRQLFRIKASRF